MENSFMKHRISTSLTLMALALCGTSFAQTAAPAVPAATPDFTLSYYVAGVTDYRFRGVSQTSKKPALQAGIDFGHSSGFYLGAFGSNVNWVKDFNGASKGSVEIDLYGGFKKEIIKDLTIDGGLITYRYPGNNSGKAGTPGAGGVSNANTNEIYGAVTYSLFTAKYSRSLGDFLGNINSSGSQYFEAAAAIDLGNGFTLTPHAGHQKVANLSVANYTDYSLTIAKDFGNGLSVNAALIGTNSKKNGFYVQTISNNKFIAGNTGVVGLKYSF
jgi:uncharacterized protein (TIGR02001 family)